MLGLPVGIPRSNLSQMESGGRRIGSRIAKDIIEAFGINHEWWESCEGDMFLDSKYNKVKSNFKHINEPQTLKYIDIPFLSVANRQSFAAANYLTNSLKERCRIIDEADVPYNRQVIIEMDGDYMEPRYPSRTKVRAEELEQSDWLTMLPGVYAVAFSINESVTTPLNMGTCYLNPTIWKPGELPKFLWTKFTKFGKPAK